MMKSLYKGFRIFATKTFFLSCTKNVAKERNWCYYTQDMMKFPHEEGKTGMSLKKYEAFVRTVELGSLTRAAKAMGSTQSRISHVLSTLEEEYGFVLPVSYTHLTLPTT